MLSLKSIGTAEAPKIVKLRDREVPVRELTLADRHALERAFPMPILPADADTAAEQRYSEVLTERASRMLVAELVIALDWRTGDGGGWSEHRDADAAEWLVRAGEELIASGFTPREADLVLGAFDAAEASGVEATDGAGAGEDGEA